MVSRFALTVSCVALFACDGQIGDTTNLDASRADRTDIPADVGIPPECEEARAAIDPMLRSPVGAKRWWYRDYQHAALAEVSTPDLGEALSLGPLGSLAARSSVVYGLSCKASGGGHTPYHGALSATRTVAGSPGGPTIDSFLASQVGAFAERPFDVLRVGVGDRPINNQTCALSNLWITLAQLAGIDTQEFGGDDFTRVPSGGLPGFT